MGMRGYKAMGPDMTCRGLRYEVGKNYAVEGPPRLCERGFHFCERAADVWRYYGRFDSVVCEVEALGEVVGDGIKSCTNVLRVIRRMEPVAEGRLRYDNGYGYGDGDGYGYGDGYGDGDGYDNGRSIGNYMNLED